MAETHRYSLTDPGERLQYLMEMLRELSRDADPVSSINRYSDGMRRLFGNQALISVSLRGVPPGHYRVMRLLHQPGVEGEGLRSVPFAGREAPVVRGGVLADLMESGEPVVCRGMTIEWDPVLERHLSPYRALLGFPVFDRGDVLNWVFFLRTTVDAFDDHDVEMSILQANLMGGITSNKRVSHELRQASAWINREVDEIANLQRGLLPAALPASTHFDLAVHYATFERAGGDFYWTRTWNGEDGQERLGLFVADASGHGPSAAVVVAMLYTLLRCCPEPMDQPARVLDYLNHFLCTSSINHSFVTAFYGVLDVSERSLIYACAGHPMPLWSPRPQESIPLPRAQNVPLGVTLGRPHLEASLTLGPGHRLLLYTDGVTEARSSSGEFFGEERLRTTFATAQGDSAALLAQVRQALDAHAMLEKPVDDQMLLVLRLA